MDQDTINKTVADRGYAFLTQAQKDIYNKTNVPTPTSTQKPTSDVPAPSSDKYSIQWGDTLSGLARKNNTTVGALMQANPYITDPNKIYAGKDLVIPPAAKSPTPVVTADAALKQTQDAQNLIDTHTAATAQQQQQKQVATTIQQEQKKKTPEEIALDMPDEGNIWIYDINTGERKQQLANAQVPFGYTTLDKANTAPTDEVKGAVTTYRRFADGSYGAFNSATGTFTGNATEKDFKDAQTAQQASDKLAQIALGNYVLSDSEKAQIDAVKAMWETRIKDQEIANRNLTGGTKSAMALAGVGASVYGMQNVAKTITDGVNKISELTVKMNGDIQQMITAFKNDDINALKAFYDRYYQEQSDRQAEVTKMHDKVDAQLKEERQYEETRNNAIDNDIRSAITSAAAGGATQEQLAKMNDALEKHDLTAAVEAGGDTLQSTTGVVGEYNAYKRDAISRGLSPMSFDEYQTKDANRKASIARAGAQIVGDSSMSPKQVQVFTSLAESMRKNPSITAEARTLALQNAIDSVRTSPKNGANQVALIYGVIQILDSYNSAVREGEINLVQGTQGLQEKIQNLPDKISQGTPLDEAAITRYADLAQRMIDSVKLGAQKKEAEYKAQATVSGIGTQWDDYRNTYKTLSGDITSTQKEVENKNTFETNIKAIEKTNPSLFKAASTMYVSNNPTTGKPYTVDEILQAFPELK